MSLFSEIENWLTESEPKVLSLIVQIERDVQIAESDISAAMKWIAQQAPSISTDIQNVVALVMEIGLGSNPTISAAVVAANTAVAALNAYAQAYNSDSGTAQAVVQGYLAVQQARAASAQASAAAVAATKTAGAVS